MANKNLLEHKLINTYFIQSYNSEARRKYCLWLLWLQYTEQDFTAIKQMGYLNSHKRR